MNCKNNKKNRYIRRLKYCFVAKPYTAYKQSLLSKGIILIFGAAARSHWGIWSCYNIMNVGDFFFVEASDEFWEDGEEMGDFTDDRGLDSTMFGRKIGEKKCFDTVPGVLPLGSDNFRSNELGWRVDGRNRMLFLGFLFRGDRCILISGKVLHSHKTLQCKTVIL